MSLIPEILSIKTIKSILITRLTTNISLTTFRREIKIITYACLPPKCNPPSKRLKKIFLKNKNQKKIKKK